MSVFVYISAALVVAGLGAAWRYLPQWQAQSVRPNNLAALVARMQESKASALADAALLDVELAATRDDLMLATAKLALDYPVQSQDLVEVPAAMSGEFKELLDQQRSAVAA